MSYSDFHVPEQSTSDAPISQVPDARVPVRSKAPLIVTVIPPRGTSQIAVAVVPLGSASQ